jgi:N-acyl-D-aspartate/D-glutamate deacylase
MQSMNFFRRGKNPGVSKLLTSLLLTALGLTASTGSFSGQATLDLVLEGGTVVDGTGAPAQRIDVGIANGRVVTLGDLGSATADRRINVGGRVVAPGFIDVHTHADRAFSDPEEAALEGYLRQGVTTMVLGGDGYLGLDRMRTYRDQAARGEIGMNFLAFIGHNAVREAVMGMAQRAPTPQELDAMKAQVRAAMEYGAAGLSSGLMYLPGQYATTEEVIALAKVTAPFGGVYDSHVRDPANDLLASHRECLDIAAAAGVHAHPGHIKAVGGKNFGLGPDLVDLIQSRIDGGQDITVDVYPYDGAATAPVLHILYPGSDPAGEALMSRITMLLTGKNVPVVMLEEVLTDLREYWRSNTHKPEILQSAQKRTETPPPGLFSWIHTVGYTSLRIVVSENPALEGRMVTDVANELGITPFELLRRMVVEEGTSAMVTLGAIQEEDLRVLLTQPWTMVASDGEELAPSHPRGRGTFTRVLGRYVREWGVLTLEEGVHKISGLPARYLGLKNRGVLLEGAVADITVFNPDTIIDEATWSEPTLLATGVDYVFIGGKPAIDAGELKPTRLGRFVTHRKNAADDRLRLPATIESKR